LNLSMFDLAQGYKENGMQAYSQLQQREFACEPAGYEGAKHQRFVGTGYFDLVAKVVSAGSASTTALEGSTEAEQFFPMPTAIDTAPEEILLPSGD